jgi:hypothetical protein
MLESGLRCSCVRIEDCILHECAPPVVAPVALKASRRLPMVARVRPVSCEPSSWSAGSGPQDGFGSTAEPQLAHRPAADGARPETGRWVPSNAAAASERQRRDPQATWRPIRRIQRTLALRHFEAAFSHSSAATVGRSRLPILGSSPLAAIRSDRELRHRRRNRLTGPEAREPAYSRQRADGTLPQGLPDA